MYTTGGPDLTDPDDITACKRDFQLQAADLLEKAIREPILAGRVNFQSRANFTADRILTDLQWLGSGTRIHDLARAFAQYGYRLKLEMEPIE